MEMLIYILNVGAVFMYEQVKSNNAYKLWRAVKNEWNSFKILMCQNYHMLFAKSSHNIKNVLAKFCFLVDWNVLMRLKKLLETFFKNHRNIDIQKILLQEISINRIIFHCEFRSKYFSNESL